MVSDGFRMSWQRNQSDSFRFKRDAFYQSLKSKVGLAAAKAAVLRININVEGCGIVAAPVHAPSRAPLLLPLLLSHNLCTTISSGGASSGGASSGGASPGGARTREDPWQHLDELATLWGHTPKAIPGDDAAEFMHADCFKVCHRKHQIVFNPVEFHWHTMQGHIKNLVKQIKTHSRCILKHANLPTRFW
jgi:hypothetical protein